MANLLFFLIAGVAVEKPAAPLIWRECVHFSTSLSSSVLLQRYYSVSRRFFKNMYLILFYVDGYSSWGYVCALHAQNAHWCQKKGLNPLDSEWMQFWGSMWVLGNEPGSWTREDSARTTSCHFNLIPRSFNSHLKLALVLGMWWSVSFILSEYIWVLTSSDIVYILFSVSFASRIPITYMLEFLYVSKATLLITLAIYICI